MRSVQIHQHPALQGVVEISFAFDASFEKPEDVKSYRRATDRVATLAHFFAQAVKCECEGNIYGCSIRCL